MTDGAHKSDKRMNVLSKLSNVEVINLIKSIKPMKDIDFKGENTTYSVGFNTDGTYVVEGEGDDGIFVEAEEPETIVFAMREAELF